MTWMTRPTLNGTAHEHGGGSGPSAHVPGGPMPGLATPEQMATLKSSAAPKRRAIFSQLMIAHHKGGVEMAQAVVERSTNTVVTNLAKGMIIAQNGEIAYMNDLLAAR